MKVVIQCAGSKDSSAGYFRTTKGTPVKFVAHPELALPDSSCLYAHPDDRAEVGESSWRDLLTSYNATKGENSHGLFPAYRLYSRPAYADLVEKFGAKQVYILSAGWGLIRADFLTPQYDITLKADVEPFKHRKPGDRYVDYCHLTDSGTDEVVFFGGKAYLPLFCRLTARLATAALPQTTLGAITHYQSFQNFTIASRNRLQFALRHETGDPS